MIGVSDQVTTENVWISNTFVQVGTGCIWIDPPGELTQVSSPHNAVPNFGKNIRNWFKFINIDTGETIEFIAGDAVACVSTVRIRTNTIGSALINKSIAFIDINASGYWVNVICNSVVCT